MTITLTDEQQAAVSAIAAWQSGEGTSEFTLGGLAGTGKTTLIDHIRESLLGSDITTLTPTGKAAEVLRRKGVEADTIHSFIYNFRGMVDLGRTRRVYDDDLQSETVAKFDPDFERKTSLGEDRPHLIIVDEASMVSRRLYEDMTAHGIPILWVGDHGQLPPVGGDPGLMSRLDVRLDTVHRQAEGNPILRLAHHVREGGSPRGYGGATADGRLRVGHYTELRTIAERYFDREIDQVIVPFNNERHLLNRMIRKGVQRDHGPDLPRLLAGDRVICTANNRRMSVYNGMVFVVDAVHSEDDEVIVASVRAEGTSDSRTVQILPQSLGDRASDSMRSQANKNQLLCFDYGWAITAHKSQGSEWDTVLVVDLPCRQWDMRRWRYTAYTRARKNLLVAYRKD